MREKNTHGGPRVAGPGKKIGRPTDGAQPKVTTSIRISPDVLDFLASTGNKSQAIEDIVRRTKAFREFGG